ncbi:UbiD family decarboxylase [Chloroflexota bacterium]
MKNDLRDWLEKVDRMGDLKRIEGADWNEEIGCISALNSNKKGPVLLFDKVGGYPSGYRVATSVNVRPSVIALTVNLPTSYSESELSSAMVDKVGAAEREAADFPPREVETGPVMENVHSGDEVDLFEFPAPKWHELDGGRYIGTGCAVVTMDPDTQEINLGTYRVMIHDGKTLGMYAAAERHGKRHIEKYHERGQPCPIAISMGHHPLILRTAGLWLPSGSEYGFIGAMKGEPVEIITEGVTGLPIPADSEIVVAGWCHPDKRKDEGPFGEWTGYYGSWSRPEPIIEVERVYHRNDPIILGAPPHRPKWSDNIHFSRMLCGAVLHNDLTNMGIPNVRAVSISDMAHFEIIAVSIKQSYHGHAKQVGLAVVQHRMCAAGGAGRYVIVVDEDVDPNNMDDVLWAMATRADPERDIEIIHRAPTDRIDPLVGMRTDILLNSRAIIDACRPYEWINEFPIPVTMSSELVERVRQRWGDLLGF